MSPPPRHASSQFPNFDSSGFHDQFGQHRYSPLQTPGRSRNMTYDSSHAYGNRQYSHHRQSRSDVSQHSTDPFRSARVSFQNSTSVSDLFPPPPHPINAGSRPSPGGTQPFPQYQSHPSAAFPHFSHHMRPSRSSSASSTSQQPTRYRPIDTTTPPYPPSMQPYSHPPRRQIPEEDECPVCHEELPPKGPDGSTVVREQHVAECIAANFAGPSSQSRTSTPSAAVDAVVAANTAHPSDAGGVVSTPTPPVAESSRRRRHTQGMLRYRATEKDCLDETGNPQECIICFEDFKEGDEMGRLECFCKFHRVSQHLTSPHRTSLSDTLHTVMYPAMVGHQGRRILPHSSRWFRTRRFVKAWRINAIRFPPLTGLFCFLSRHSHIGMHFCSSLRSFPPVFACLCICSVALEL